MCASETSMGVVRGLFLTVSVKVVWGVLDKAPLGIRSMWVTSGSTYRAGEGGLLFRDSQARGEKVKPSHRKCLRTPRRERKVGVASSKP